MDYYNHLSTRIGDIIDNIAEDQRDNLVLYPFGQQGMLAKQILNWKYGIKESFILDEGLAKKNKKIKSLNYLKEIDTSKYLFLITSDNLDYWDQIRKNLRKYVQEKNIIDLYTYRPLRYKDIRIASLEMAAREIYEKNISGAVAEAGVYRGDFACYINEFLPDKHLYLFDTFEGFTERDIMIDKERGYTYKDSGLFANTSVEIVLQKMTNRNNVIVKKGYFPDTTVGLEEKFCFVSLDMDLYQPILAGLEYFYPRLCAGGYIFVHDCHIEQAEFRGARQALLEFVHKENIGYVMLPDGSTAVLTKPDYM